VSVTVYFTEICSYTFADNSDCKCATVRSDNLSVSLSGNSRLFSQRFTQCLWRVNVLTGSSAVAEKSRDDAEAPVSHY